MREVFSLRNLFHYFVFIYFLFACYKNLLMNWFIILKGSIDLNVLNDIIIQFQNMMIQAVNNKAFMLGNALLLLLMYFPSNIGYSQAAFVLSGYFHNVAAIATPE